MIKQDESHLQPCPMGCGRVTEDPAGGPCEACWDEVRREHREEARHDYERQQDAV